MIIVFLARENLSNTLYCYRKWGLATRRPKANTREATLVEGKVCFVSEAGNPGRGRTCVQRLTPPTDNQWARAFIDRGRGLHSETAQSAPTGILKLVTGRLTSVISIVLGTGNLQLQGQLVPIP